MTQAHEAQAHEAQAHEAQAHEAQAHEAQARDRQPAAGTSALPTTERVVVVGIDGSRGSAAALAWAAEEARLRGARLRAVHAWHVPTVAYAGIGYVPPATAGDTEGDARAALSAQISDVLGARRALDVEPEVAEGQAARVLLDAAEGAEMVVVGARGRGGLAGLHLGSVSTRVAHQARCPVVIVRS